MHLLEFITQLKLQSVSADLTTFVEGRKLGDDASIMIRLNNGAKGSLSISQVATGEENNFTVAIYGDKGALKWSQENPNYATFSQVGEPSQIITEVVLSKLRELKLTFESLLVIQKVILKHLHKFIQMLPMSYKIRKIRKNY